MEVNLGGNRLGSGNKMNVELKNYSRSTHNLNKKFRSTMAPGVLYPAYVLPALVGDDIDIDINAMVKTLPTNGPLMGTFKFQADVFQCPIRLYQGLLHNNTLNMGLNMKNVLLPKMLLKTDYDKEAVDFTNCQINPTSLVKYCGISGIGIPSENTTSQGCKREFSGLPVLMYYDCFKNYYANKQEEYAYVITGQTESGAVNAKVIQRRYESEDISSEREIQEDNTSFTAVASPTYAVEYTITGEYLENVKITQICSDGLEYEFYLTEESFNVYTEQADYICIDRSKIEIRKNYVKVTLVFDWELVPEDYFMVFKWNNTKTVERISKEVILQPFELENIDKMRRLILSKNELGDRLLLGDGDETDFLPYSLITDTHENGDKDETNNLFGMNGLCIKTYQSDLFNNWINTEWIDGDNGVNAISKVQVEDGAFTIDALNLAQKVYNLLNRIVTCDGTYQAWQSAVSGQEVSGHYETPLYCGGMSSEIVFEEIASSAASGDQPLGTLAGRGRMDGSKGGHLTIHVNELSYIMVIVSITPRIDYFQGNKWFMTDIDTVDDFHKPALDGIGFQDLIGEQMAWWDTYLQWGATGQPATIQRTTVGKVPAWINYMTDVDEVFGDFARGDGKNFMVLGRSYDMYLDEDEIPRVKDFTTYIDPAKFNYAFTDSSRDAQNFWCQMLFDVKARRIMSAKMIPNL